MAKPSTGKHELIDKANSRVVATVAIAAFLTVFSLIASQALFRQRNYQARVIEKKEAAVQQLIENKQAVEDLEVSYRAFVETPENIIGGNSGATGGRDGDNAKIVLDALPSKYDYPALISSIEKVMSEGNFRLESISGDDDEVAQTDADSQEPVEMPFELSSEVNSYERVRDLLTVLYRSIRPIDIKELSISGSNESELSVDIDGFTYYQPSKGLTIDKEEVK